MVEKWLRDMTDLALSTRERDMDADIAETESALLAPLSVSSRITYQRSKMALKVLNLFWERCCSLPKPLAASAPEGSH